MFGSLAHEWASKSELPLSSPFVETNEFNHIGAQRQIFQKAAADGREVWFCRISLIAVTSGICILIEDTLQNLVKGDLSLGCGLRHQ